MKPEFKRLGPAAAGHIMQKNVLALASLLITHFVYAGYPFLGPGLSVSIEPHYVVAQIGDVFTVDVMYAPIGVEAPLGGAYDVRFDPSIVELVDYEYDPIIPQWMQSTPVKHDGGLNSLAFGGCVQTTSRMATLTFRVVGEGGGKIELGGALGVASWQNGCVDFIIGYFEADYVPGFVQVVPQSSAENKY